MQLHDQALEIQLALLQTLWIDKAALIPEGSECEPSPHLFIGERVTIQGGCQNKGGDSNPSNTMNYYVINNYELNTSENCDIFVK